MIELKRASRWYGPVIGINDISCTIGPGITALLGPNGAGKSTMLKLVTGQLRPTQGHVTVFGKRPFANPEVFRNLGYCPEGESGYDEMTGREFVTLLAAMSGLRKADLGRRVADSIERMGMTPNADRKIGGYSKGMRQRIKMAQCMVHDPDVVILDEPLNGLDPVSRHEVSKMFREMADAGKCLLVSSHILYEVEQLTHNILLVSRGRLLAQGDIYEIRRLIDAHPHQISISTSSPREMAKRLIDLEYVLSATLDDRDANRLEVQTRAPESFYSAFPTIVLDGGFKVDSFESPDNNLEAVFTYLVKG